MLTVSERILYHLQAYVKYEDKFEVPYDMTQDGISQACGISRAHAAVELKKLKTAGIIDEKLSHVRKGKMRRKVYLLTPAGKAGAADVVQYVTDNGIKPMVDAAAISPTVLSGASRSAKRSTPIPHVRYFFGREDDLKALRSALAQPSVKVLSVRGIAGIGKSTIVAKLAPELTGQRLFWYSVKPWDSARTVAEALGNFFTENGRRRLSAYLATGKFDLGEMSFLVNDELAENGYTFVFDDVDSSAGIQEFLRMFRQSSGSAKMIVTAEHEPGFYDRSDIVARNEVIEVEIGGLAKDAARQLLESRGIKGSTADELAALTNGHPLSLEMVTEDTPAGAKYQVSKFFEEKFYAGLPDAEKALLQLASVFQRPFSADAVPKDLRHARKGSMLREVVPGMFEIHASLRSFVYESMSREERVRWHSHAADFYLREGDTHERLYHLLRANRSLEAEMMVSRLGEELLGRGNAHRLWAAIASHEPSKPKYRDQFLLTKARVASMVGELDIAWGILEGLSGADAPTRGDALVEMGRIKSKKGEFEDASGLYSKAMESSKDSPGLRAKALRGLGTVEGKLGNYARAQELLERSARESMAAMDQKGMLLAHLELGNVFIGRGRYEEAIDHFSKCAGGFGPVELTNVYVNMGIACAHLNRSGEAELHLRNAVRLADETGQPRAKAYALTSLADVLMRSGSAEDAKELCFSALEVFTEVGDRLGTSAAYANLGLAERLTGNLKASEEYYNESLSSLEGMDVPWSMGVRQMEFATMLAEKGESDRAASMLKSSKDLFRRIDAKDMLSKVDRELKELSKGA